MGPSPRCRSRKRSGLRWWTVPCPPCPCHPGRSSEKSHRCSKPAVDRPVRETPFQSLSVRGLNVTYGACPGSCPAAKSVEHIFHNVVAFELKDSLSRRADFHARGGTRAILNNLGEASPLNLFHWCTLHAPAQEEAAKESKDIARMFTELTSCPTTDQDELEWLLRIAMNITHGRPKPSATFTRLGAARACIRLLDQRFQQDVITLALGLLVSLNYYSMVEFSIEDMKMVLRSMIKGGPAAGYGAILLGLAYGNQPELYEQLNIPSRKANAEVVQEFQGFLRDNRILTEGMAKICERAENNLQRD
mmetsp:Transcript_16048/g.66109  ORF Transcript_16048/g.66109 Transcript_16048/m.66109 type:complete len:305 (-) Transcript_16048:561-1475(-)